MRTRLAALAVITIFATLGLDHRRYVAAQSTSVDIEVRVAAQRLADGRTEFALQHREPGSEWSERALPRARFFPATADVGRWLTSTPLTVRAPGADADDDGAEVRVTARRLADGRTEFALRYREPDAEWSGRVLPRARFFPASPRVGRWLVSSPLTVAAPQPEAAAAGAFTSVDAGYDHTCAIRNDGTVACWGSDPHGGRPPGGSFTSVSAGWGHICGVRTGGTVVCWGSDQFGKATPPSGAFSSVDTWWDHNCGIRADGTVACWGNDESGQSTPPAGSFTSVSTGYRHTCGVRTDGTVACWGTDYGGQSHTARRLVLLGQHRVRPQLRAADRRTPSPAGARNYDGESAPPEGPFTAVGAGSSHTCGIQTDGTVACWGSDFHGQSTPPEGSFTSLTAGGDHTCGLRTDGAIACWGNDADGRATPPGGTFASISAEVYHTCGLLTDGTVVCWGDDHRTPPPAGLVHVGERRGCPRLRDPDRRHGRVLGRAATTGERRRPAAPSPPSARGVATPVGYAPTARSPAGAENYDGESAAPEGHVHRGQRRVASTPAGSAPAARSPAGATTPVARRRRPPARSPR